MGQRMIQNNKERERREEDLQYYYSINLLINDDES
jgi:hypothetical protein